ncbi:MAG: ABC transporter transmembrane domain-containing protein, partial [Chloroflexota bacterium]
MPQSKLYPEINLQTTISNNRLFGLWRLMTGFRWIYLGSALSLAIAAGTKAYSYVLLRDFADTALSSETGATPLYYFAIALVGLALLEAGFTFFHGRLVARAAEGVILRLRNYLFDHLQRLSFKYHDHMQTGELIQRVSSDVDAVRRFFADQGTQIGRIITLF